MKAAAPPKAYLQKQQEKKAAASSHASSLRDRRGPERTHANKTKTVFYFITLCDNPHLIAFCLLCKYLQPLRKKNYYCWDA